MKSRWKDKDAEAFVRRYAAAGRDLALRTYSARLIGQDPNLVLHGGGNTSVKTIVKTIDGESVRVICVKGSGWDLDTIEPAGHPAVKLSALLKLRQLDRLSDEEMVNSLRTHMLEAAGPTPSVETLLHAYLPHTYIDHSHADAVLSITNQPQGEALVRRWVNGKMGIVPYIMPGFALAKLAAEVYESRPEVEGLILLKHGIFTFGKTARESYERMIRWVDRAQRMIAHAKAFSYRPLKIETSTGAADIAAAAALLRGQCAPTRMLVRHRSSAEILKFVNSREAPRFSQQGPVTPDHIIRTKAVPLILPAVSPSDETAYRHSAQKAMAAYQRRYISYFERQSRIKKVQRQQLDALPRIALAPGLGLFAIAADAKAADVSLDIYEHTIRVITNASRLGSYEALSEGHLFDMEYWSLEQAKLGKSVEKPFSRHVVWISGAASGIGLATAKAFLKSGAHVFMTDRNQAALLSAAQGLGKQAAYAPCDVTKQEAVAHSFDHCSALFGGVDIVISNAGVAPTGDMADCSDRLLRESFEINFFSHQYVAQTAIRVFKRQGIGGALLFNASKSAFNPGPGFGPYSIPKAAVIALMRQYALELGSLGVRVNAVNADRVQTGLFSGGLLAKRARARGLTLESYIKGNLLGQEVLADDVAQAFLALAQSHKTTGAVLPVDGGNAAAFPR